MLQHSTTCCNTVQHCATCCITVRHVALLRRVATQCDTVSNTVQKVPGTPRARMCSRVRTGWCALADAAAGRAAVLQMECGRERSRRVGGMLCARWQSSGECRQRLTTSSGYLLLADVACCMRNVACRRRSKTSTSGSPMWTSKIARPLLCRPRFVVFGHAATGRCWCITHTPTNTRERARARTDARTHAATHRRAHARSHARTQTIPPLARIQPSLRRFGLEKSAENAVVVCLFVFCWHRALWVYS
jgi:hypothetical protein